MRLPAFVWCFLFPLFSCYGDEIPPQTDDGTRVAVLGYHDFSDSLPETEMRMTSDHFRKQMEAIRDSGIAVISMDDFDAWKKGEKEIPKQAIVITLDDGWKAVYTHAFPIMKEFGFPFTLFLYKNYIDGGGRAVSTEMVKEMMKNGAHIGSHSVSHPYPATFKKIRKQGSEDYTKFLRNEFGESKRFLESNFGETVYSYAYPGGFVTDEMFTIANEFGYRYLFTVIPGKISRDTDNLNLPRYIALGTQDHVFEMALRFNNQIAAGGLIETPAVPAIPYPVVPAVDSVITDRLPLISIDLSAEATLNPETLSMQVAGFGVVPASWDAENKTLQWKVNRRLRTRSCRVEVTWKDAQGKSQSVKWSFRLDLEAAYLQIQASAQ